MDKSKFYTPDGEVPYTVESKFWTKKKPTGDVGQSSNRGNYMKVDSMLPLVLNGCQEVFYF